jgi:Peptidase family M23
MDAPRKPAMPPLLEKLGGPPSVTPPWKWIGLGAGSMLLIGAAVVVVVLAVGGGKGPSASKKTAAPDRASLPDMANPEEAPITGSRAASSGGRSDGRASGRRRPGADTTPANAANATNATNAETPATLAAPVRTADGMMLYRGTVTAGTPLITTLKRAGAGTGHSLGLLKALGKLFNLRRSRPGHRFEVHVDPQSRMPVYFRYQVSLARIFEVRRAGDQFEARPVKVPVTKRLLRYGGLVGVSLGGELASRGAHPALLSGIVSVLTSQPKFFRAQRFCDQYRVLVEEEQVSGHHLRFGAVLALEYRSVRNTPPLRLYYFRPGKEPGVYYNDKGVSLPTSRLHIPVNYTRISSPFGMRFHPVLKRRKLHSGVDFVAPAGTPVRSTLPGKVIFAGRRGAFGNLVVVDHGDGLQSYYAHLLRFRRGLKRGKKVRARRAIGYVGSTGRSTGPHLHFGLKLAGRWIDPLTYRIRPGRPPSAIHRARLSRIIAKRRQQLKSTFIWGPIQLPARIPSHDEVVTGVEEP